MKLLITFNQKIAYLEDKLGQELFDRSKVIEVNYNESLLRLAAYDVVWLMPEFSI